ncbi:TolC family protein [Massilia agilis]|uniref:TolC family protein n=1 Tax=Massilia agilis TaxID=1811226 RepID=A0ABT2D694_9BURK|nr:TolC family protein [Massilia agilis]MCS0806314.1 TolC family protein [Massilia agilis]
MFSRIRLAALRRRTTPAMLAPAVLALAFAGPAMASGTGLTFPEAQQRALGRSLQLRAQDAAVTASQELAAAARQLPDPMLKAGVENVPLSGPDRYSLGRDSMTMRRIGIEQELTRSVKRDLRAQRYERVANKTRAEQVAAAGAVERDTALAWLDLYYFEQMAQVVAEQAGQAEALVVAVDAAYRGGRSSRADLLAARSALAMVHDRASAIERQRQSARTTLVRWVGELPGLALAGSPDLTHIRHDPDTLPHQLEHHPEVSVLNRAADLASTEARLADAESRPDWRVELAFQQRGPDYPNMVSFGVAVPLQWDRKHRQDREIAARLALADQARDERDEALRMHTAETANQVGEWRTGLERMDRYRTELLPLAHERADALLAAYRGGKSALADVIAARRDELETRLQSLQLEADTARLWARLNFLFPTSQMNTVSNLNKPEAP